MDSCRDKVPVTPEARARNLRNLIPQGGLFSGKLWRIAPNSISLPEKLYDKILNLGPQLHAFNKACNLLYRQSVEGKQPEWIRRYLDAGKSERLLNAARHVEFKNDLPFVIRPDLMVTEEGFAITELDSVPGGIGLTAWFQDSYAQLDGTESAGPGMLGAFIGSIRSLQKNAESAAMNVAIVVSREAADYRPEMEWLVQQVSRKQSDCRISVCAPEDLRCEANGVFLGKERISFVYRFFELFDLPNIAGVEQLIDSAMRGLVQVFPPFKPQLEEKLWLALFWFPQLAEFWRRQLGDRYFRDLKELIPFTWILDPSQLPPHAVIPHLNIHDWRQLGGFSQKQRDLILKISGFSEKAWGSRGVFLGSDMPLDDWKKRVEEALNDFERHPYILQNFAKTRLIDHEWYDFDKEKMESMKGRLRLCPYYFVKDDRAELAGILATLCPADKKLIHGMESAIMTLAVKN